MELDKKIQKKILELQKKIFPALKKRKDVTISGRSAYRFTPIVDIVGEYLRNSSELSVVTETTSSDIKVDSNSKIASAVIVGRMIVTDLETGYSVSYNGIGVSSMGDKSVDIANTFMKRNLFKSVFQAIGIEKDEVYLEDTKKTQDFKQAITVDFTNCKDTVDFTREIQKYKPPVHIVKKVIKEMGAEKLSDLERNKWVLFLTKLNQALKGE